MKNSGVQWIGDIPSSWNIKPVYKYFHDHIFLNLDYEFQRAFQFNYGTLKYKNEIGDLELYKDTYIKYSKVKKNDIIINGLNLNYDFISQRVAITPENGIITSAYIAMRPFDHTNSSYFCYVFKAMDNMKLFHSMGKGIRLTLSFDELKRKRLPIPPLSEQKVIADFLDAKCGEIDGLLADLDAEVKMLTEYKKSVIAETVTRGLNPNAPMKSSGIPWVGEIPKHWQLHPVYYYYTQRVHKNIFGDEQNLLSLSYGKIIRKDINSIGGLIPASYNTYNIVEKNDIIIRPTDLQNDKRSLRTGLVTEHGIITSAYIALKPSSGVYSPFFHYLLHSYDVKKVFYNMGDGVRQGLNYSEFSRLMLIEPPIDEQIEIANYLDSKCAAIDQAITDKTQQIETLKAYKSSLIYEYVTGKKQVL